MNIKQRTKRIPSRITSTAACINKIFMIKSNIILKPTVCISGICFGKNKTDVTYFLGHSAVSGKKHEFRLIGITHEEQKFIIEE